MMWIETFMFGATLDSKICARSVSRQSLHIDYWTLISSKPMATTKRWWPPYNLLVGFMLIGGCEKEQPRWLQSRHITVLFDARIGSDPWWIPIHLVVHRHQCVGGCHRQSLCSIAGTLLHASQWGDSGLSHVWWNQQPHTSGGSAWWMGRDLCHGAIANHW